MKKKEQYLRRSIESKMKLIVLMAQRFGLLEILESEVNILLKRMNDRAAKMMIVDINAIKAVFGIDDKTTFFHCDGPIIIDDLGKDDE